MSTKFIDLTGKKFSRLLVVREFGHNKHGQITWLCQCDCGKKVVKLGYDLRKTTAKSCGCLRRGENLVGRVFGTLTVITDAPSKLYIRKNGIHKGQKCTRLMWWCKCNCGKEKIVSGAALKSGKTKGCGSVPCSNIGQFRWKHYHPQQAAINHVYNYYKYAAKKKKLEWNLSHDQFEFITRQNCHYCGISPSKKSKADAGNKFKEDFIYNGVDRKDNLQGYVDSNVLPCCEICNLAKRNLTYDEFCTYLSRITEHRKSLCQI